MNTPDIAMALTWANRTDPRIGLEDDAKHPGINDPILARWEAGLQHVTANAMQVNGVITDYYANAHAADNGYLPPITPQIIRKRLSDAREHKAASQSATDMSARQLEPPHRPERSWRARNPGRWEAEVRRGREERRQDLASRGVPLHQWQIDGKPNPNGGTL